VYGFSQGAEHDTLDMRKDLSKKLDRLKQLNLPIILPDSVRHATERYIYINVEDDKKEELINQQITIDDEYILQDDERDTGGEIEGAIEPKQEKPDYSRGNGTPEKF